MTGLAADQGARHGHDFAARCGQRAKGVGTGRRLRFFFVYLVEDRVIEDAFHVLVDEIRRCPDARLADVLPQGRTAGPQERVAIGVEVAHRYIGRTPLS